MRRGDDVTLVSVPVALAPSDTSEPGFNTLFRVGRGAGARLSGVGDMLNFRMCASSEGLHLTAREGTPVTGKRVWHRYLYLGYDVEPTCTSGDYP